MAGYGLGGFGVLALLCRSPLFRAAISTAGVANFSAWYGTLGVWRGQTDTFIADQCEGLLGASGGPWSDPWRYVQESPLFTLNRVQTPLLLVAG